MVFSTPSHLLSVTAVRVRAGGPGPCGASGRSWRRSPPVRLALALLGPGPGGKRRWCLPGAALGNETEQRPGFAAARVCLA